MANFVSPNQIQIQIGLVLLVRPDTRDDTSQPCPLTCNIFNKSNNAFYHENYRCRCHRNAYLYFPLQIRNAFLPEELSIEIDKYISSKVDCGRLNICIGVMVVGLLLMIVLHLFEVAYQIL